MGVMPKIFTIINCSAASRCVGSRHGLEEGDVLSESRLCESGSDGARRYNLLSLRAAGSAGLVFSGLLTVSLVLMHKALATSHNVDLVTWFYQEVSPTATLVSLYLIPFAGIAFLWFMAGLRHSAATRNDRLFDTVLLGSGFLFVAMLFSAAAILAALVSHLTESSDFVISSGDVRVARLMMFSFFNVFAARAAGVFVMVSSTMFLRSKLLPRWIPLLGIVFAVALLLGMSLLRLLIFLFPAWICLVSIALLTRQRTNAEA
jgi:hypothetical protein